MELEQLRQDILHWSENFVERPHPALGGWAPCPFARSARLKNTIGIFVGTDPYYDLKNRNNQGMGPYEVVIYAYDPAEWNYDLFSTSLAQANHEFLQHNDLIALEDHPDDPEIVNGIQMNQGQYALALVQPLADLDQRARGMAQKGFYHAWPEEYLKILFQHRKDPRT
jgi:hypothetical protein